MHEVLDFTSGQNRLFVISEKVYKLYNQRAK